MNFIQKINVRKLLPIALVLLVLFGLTAFSIYVSKLNEKKQTALIQRLTDTLTEPYSVKDGKIYYQSSLMEEVDLATFEPLSNRSFSRDKNHVYYVTKILEGADPATFEFFSDYFGLARDKNKVYISGKPIEGADPKTYALIKGTGYAKDKSHVFIDTRQIPGADPATFEPLTVVRMRSDGPIALYGTYSKDAKSIYFVPSDRELQPEAVPNSDPATFQPFITKDGTTWYLKDKNLVYHFENGPLPNSDPMTFEVLDSIYRGYSRDAHQAYYLSKPISSVDLATFKVIGDGYAKDKNHLYHEGDAIFDLSTGANPFEQAAVHLLDITPKGDVAVDYIVNTYYDLTLYYGNFSEYNIFGNNDPNSFFEPFFKSLKRSTFDLATFVPFRLAFVAPNSPASLFDFPQPVGPGIGGDVVGRKFLDPDTMLVYASSGWQGHLGPPPGLCKEGGLNIDKFIFKRINGEWKIWDIKEQIDSWTTNNEGYTEEDCKEINQDKIEKYKI